MLSARSFFVGKVVKCLWLILTELLVTWVVDTDKDQYS